MCLSQTKNTSNVLKLLPCITLIIFSFVYVLPVLISTNNRSAIILGFDLFDFFSKWCITYVRSPSQATSEPSFSRPLNHLECYRGRVLNPNKSGSAVSKQMACTASEHSRHERNREISNPPNPPTTVRHIFFQRDNPLQTFKPAKTQLSIPPSKS